MAKQSKPFTPGRRPDYKVSAMNKFNDHKGQVGAAWLNDNGSISIKLNAFVVLSAENDLVITLFPHDGGGSQPRGSDTTKEEDNDESQEKPAIPF